MTGQPDYMAAARAEIARRAAVAHPGWRITHGLYGWTAIRDRDGHAETARNIPALDILIGIADRDLGPPATSAPWPSPGRRDAFQPVAPLPGCPAPIGR